MKPAAPVSAYLIKLVPFLVVATGGCAVSGNYPADWPADEDEQVGTCPKIAGTFSNIGVHHPPAAVPLTLTLSQVLGLPDGDRVTIDQSPDTISVAVSRPGQPAETIVFSSGKVSAYGLTGWDTTRPRTFSCVINVPDFRHRLSFSHLMRSSISGVGGFGAGMVAASGESVHFTKGTDGSLLLHFSKGWGALIGPMPVGASEQFWVRFAPASP